MRYVFILSACFALSVLHAQSKKQIKELKIKAVTETTTTYTNGKESSPYKSAYKTFDKEGNTLTDIEYNPDGTVQRKETNKYAGKDKTEEIIEHPSGGSDASDNTAPKKYKRTTFKYNANGDKIEEVEYDASGVIIKKTTYTYNAKGDKMFEMEYDGAGRILKKIAYAYDAKGLKTERKVYGAGGEILEKHEVYTYSY